MNTATQNPDISGLSPAAQARIAKAQSDIEIAQAKDPKLLLAALHAEAKSYRDSINTEDIENPADFLRMFEALHVRAKNFVAVLYPKPLP